MIKDVLAAQQGDGDAFVRLMQELKPAMYRLSRSYGLADEDCAEVMQETAVRVYRSMGQVREPAYFRTWVMRIVINEARRLQASRRKVVPLSETLYAQQASGSRMETAVEVQEAIGALDEELRETVILYYMNDLPVKDAAELLGIPEGTVKSRLARARIKLAGLLGVNEGGASHG